MGSAIVGRSWIIIVMMMLCRPALAQGDHPVFLEAQGVVVIEAESTASDPGDWEGKKTVEGFTGEGHIEFTGNRPAGGDPGTQLVYYFKVTTPGTYQLFLRGHKRLAGEAPDKCNDCYVRVEGRYGAPDDAGDEHGDNARLATLRQDTKLYGGSDRGWGWASQLDLGGHNNKRNARYVFRAGQTYALAVSGRSQRFNLDRIVFVHEDADEREAKAPETAESDRD